MAEQKPAAKAAAKKQPSVEERVQALEDHIDAIQADLGAQLNISLPARVPDEEEPAAEAEAAEAS